MGTAISVEIQSQRDHSRHIDHEINEERKSSSNVVKLLLLGAAEGGKSTVLKQMKILHNHGFSQEEIHFQRNIIYQNLLHSALDVMKTMKELEIEFENANCEIDQIIIHECVKLDDFEKVSSLDIRNGLKRLWQDKGFQKCFSQYDECYLSESTKYFFNQIDRICTPEYSPTEQDVLRARVATTGITEVKFKFKSAIFRVIDVGGQRSERRKWIHCFADVDAVIFVAALSEYNMKLLEDNKTNRIHESIQLFSKICNCKWFRKTSMIIFLNKTDIFIEKLKTVPLTIAFPEYDGLSLYEPCVKYVEKKFLSENHTTTEKHLYIHRTCATDTKNIEFVFGACSDIILQSGMKTTGLL